MDFIIILRKGPEWNIRLLCHNHRQLIADRFHRLARRNGSQAVWRAETGEVVTTDPTEQAKRLPYEQWALAGYRLIEEVWEMEADWADAGGNPFTSQWTH